MEFPLHPLISIVCVLIDDDRGEEERGEGEGRGGEERSTSIRHWRTNQHCVCVEYQTDNVAGEREREGR